MTQGLYILLAGMSGAGIAMQASMLGAMGALRSPSAAVWVSLLATVAGLSSYVAYRCATSSIDLPAPFDRPYVMIVFAVVSMVTLAFSARGVGWHFTLTGLMPIPFLVGAGFSWWAPAFSRPVWAWGCSSPASSQGSLRPHPCSTTTARSG